MVFASLHHATPVVLSMVHRGLGDIFSAFSSLDYHSLWKSQGNKRTSSRFQIQIYSDPSSVATFFFIVQIDSNCIRFAYVFKGYVFLVLVFHLALLNGVITVRNALQRDLKSVVYYFSSYCLLNVPFVFHSSAALLKWNRIECHPTILRNLVLVSLENIVMVILSVKVSRPDAKHMDILEPVAIACVVTGLFLHGYHLFCSVLQILRPYEGTIISKT